MLSALRPFFPPLKTAPGCKKPSSPPLSFPAHNAGDRAGRTYSNPTDSLTGFCPAWTVSLEQTGPGLQKRQGQGTHVYVVGINVVSIGVSQHRVQFHTVPIICKHRAGGTGWKRGPRARAGEKCFLEAGALKAQADQKVWAPREAGQSRSQSLGFGVKEAQEHVLFR